MWLKNMISLLPSNGPLNGSSLVLKRPVSPSDVARSQGIQVWDRTRGGGISAGSPRPAGACGSADAECPCRLRPRLATCYVPDIERNRDAYRLRERAQGWDNDIINVPRKGRTHRDKLAPTEITSSRNRTGDRRGGPGRVWIPRSPRLVA